MPQDDRIKRMRIWGWILAGGILPVFLMSAAWAADEDNDGLPTEMEKILGTYSTVADSDGDGWGDRSEWLARTDPLDAGSVPFNCQGVRGFAWQTAPGAPVKIFVAVYPASRRPDLKVFLGSPRLDGSDPDYNTQEITPPLGPAPPPHPDGAAGITFTLVTDPPESLPALSPLSIGMVAGSQSQGTVVLDRFLLLANSANPGDIGNLGLESMVGPPNNTMTLTSLDPAARGDEGPTPPQDPGGGAAGEEPEVCLMQLSDARPDENGSVSYTITSASCQPDKFLYCDPVACTGMNGQEIVMIDYGFLQSKSD